MSAPRAPAHPPASSPPAPTPGPGPTPGPADEATPTPRVGVYVCHCGTNIAGVVDVEAVRDWAVDRLGPHGVVVARDYPFMCSSLGQELIEKDIAELGLDRVVVAACSPHMHERTFRGACERAGLNPYLCELVSIREQVSWVHTDHVAATRKAEAIVAGGVLRVREQVPLEPLRVPINPATLVVGGGIAGISAALELADAGYPVHLVERQPSIGGHMAQFDKTFPTLDCAACILTPRMVAVGAHPNITMHTWSEVTEVSGYVGAFTVKILHRPRYVDTDLCTGCGICEEKCPAKVVDQVFESGIGYRKGIYRPFPQAVPKYPVLDPEHCIYFERGTCKACQKLCPTGAIDFDQQSEEVTVEVGDIVLATGFAPFDARRVEPYGYGHLANVFTSLEFERMSNASGPTGGRIVLRDGVTEPRSVAIVHCVGSRDRNFNAYCSAICCMQSMKFAHLVREHTDATVYELYIDIRAPGKGFDEFYQRVQNEGTIFIRGRVAEITDTLRLPGEAADDGQLIVQVEDTLAGRQRRIPVDMVVLSVGLEPQPDAHDVARLFGITCSSDGWIIERHPKLDPVATMTEGVFAAGCALGPRDIPSSVASGAAAAARILGRIAQGEMALEPVRAVVDQARCSDCRICGDLCPFSAISFEPGRRADVNPALCQGCGVCVAACPAGAIAATGFSDAQILGQIDGLLLSGLDGRADGGAPRRAVVQEAVPA